MYRGCWGVQETLCGLELQHVQRSCARGSSKRSILKQRTGAFLVRTG